MSEWVVRFMRWLINRLGRGTLLSLLIAFCLIASLAEGLADSVRALESGLLVSTGLAALLLSWWLARSKLPGLLSAFILSASGFLYLLILVGRLGGELLRLTVALNNWISGILAWVPGFPAPEGTALALAWADFWMQISGLGARLASWSEDLIYRRAAFDPVSGSLVWGLVVWLTAAWLAWALRRWERPMIAALPASGVLVIVLSLSGETSYLLLVSLAATLALTAVRHYQASEKSWQRREIDYSEEIRLDVSLVSIGLVFSLTMVAAAAPTVSLRSMVDFVEEAFQQPAPAPKLQAAGPGPGKPNQPPATIPYEDPGASLGLDTGPRPTQFNPLTGLSLVGLPRDHLIGSGPELSEEVVMWVSEPGATPATSDPTGREEPPRYYWRALTYDIYSGSGWASSDTSKIQYEKNQWTLRRENLVPADAQVSEVLLPGQDLVVQDFRLFSDEPANLVFSAGDILTIDQDYEIAWRKAGEPGGRADPMWAGRDFFGASVSGSQYQINSLQPSPGVEELRSAGSRYPDWILLRYLQLPDDVPGRVRRLAQELTATSATPYDQALSIEGYLREFPYTLDVPAPPDGRDVADFFLFDLRQGYCDYYASSMVVLARASGLPARLAVGYAGGIYDFEQEHYVVSQAEAHSWPEIYFPDYGWVPFEPTAGLAALERPGSVTPERLAIDQLPQETGNWRTFANLVMIALVFLILGGFLVWVVRAAAGFLILVPMTPEGVLPAVYARLHRQSSLLQVPHQRGDTPYEFGAAFESRVRSLAGQRQSWTRFLDPAAEEANHLIDLYARTRYSQKKPAEGDKRQALQLWSRLQPRLWLARLRLLLVRRSE